MAGNKRKRGWEGSLDPLPEDDEENKIYTFNSGNDESLMSSLLSLIPRWFFSRSEASGSTDELDELSSAVITPPETETLADIPKESNPALDSSKPSAPFGASVELAPFVEALGGIQDTILENEYIAGAGLPCLCGAGVALYRCGDCFDAGVSCKTCFLQAHLHHPFHRIQNWVDTHFAKYSLEDLQMELHLGHGGARCPNLPTRTSYQGRRFTIGHINGFHYMRINFCHCLGAPKGPYQLLKANLFPATMEQPETAFTFQLLDNFHIHSLTSKKSMYDYHQALQHLTDAAFPDKVKNRYRECLRTNRLWRHLSSVRRSGQAHDIDTHLPHRRPGSLAVRCPACPEPDFNIKPSVLNKSKPHESHKYMYFISVDGNFRLQQSFKSSKNSDPDDVSLNAGNAYFVPNGPYQEYLKGLKEDDTQSTCAHLNAARLQNVAKFKNARVSGVVSVQCARHAFFLPQGTVDLEKGEAYARTDFALAFALREAAGLPWIRCSYDIWCHFVINLLTRIQMFFMGVYPIFKKITGSIPKMHVKNHIDSCQNRWSFNFLPNSGETCGESIETTWAEQNQTAAATREMNSGHRHDTLNDFFGYWNFQKFRTVSNLLAKRYKDCLVRKGEYEKSFNELTTRYQKNSPKILEKWQKMDILPKQEGNEWISVYQAHFQGDKPPTQRKVYEDLLRSDMKQEIKRVDQPAGKYWVVFEGIEIELDQHRLRKLVTALSPDVEDSTAQNSVLTARLLLMRRLRKWRTYQKFHCTTLSSLLDVSDDVPPEDVPLYLPSSFSKYKRDTLGLKELGEAELGLRRGQCYDALDRIRLAIKVFNYNCKFTQSEIIGQGPNTRAQAFLRSLKAEQYSDAEIYCLGRDAYLALKYSTGDEMAIASDSFKPLLDAELWGKDTTRQPVLGDTHREEPWFWTIDCPPGVDPGEWSVELDRVQWFRYLATLQRSIEEIEILQEEISRTYKSFSKLDTVWTAIGQRMTRPGARCYAYKQAAMYNRFTVATMETMKDTFRFKDKDIAKL